MNDTVKSFFKKKNIFITGGTGSFGHQIVEELIKIGPNRIIIFSRDEKKQYDMKNFFGDNDLLEFHLGDVRDYDRLYELTKNVDIIYHAAALKQVPNCEFNPFEAVLTNIIGAQNVRNSAINNGVDILVAISTDKAVKPVNTMGMTKAIQEKIMINSNDDRWHTKFICVRYGNVIGSRGSVIPFFKELIDKRKPLPMTDFRMTRFLISLKEAIGLVFKSTMEGKGGEIFVKKMPACNIKDLAEVMAFELTGRKDYPIIEVGVRPGEKIHEVLVSEEEMRRAKETKEHFIINPPHLSKKSQLISNLFEYTSDNTTQLNKVELAKLLRSENWI